MIQKNKPYFLSVIIINWNGKKWLKGCLDSLEKQSYKGFEVIMVDNASSDDSIQFVKKRYPHVKIVESNINVGFAGGNNLGFKSAKGDLVLLLNNDTKVEKNFIHDFIKSFDEIPNLAAAQSKIVLMSEPDKLDSCGAYWTDFTLLYHYGNRKDQKISKYNKSFPVFSNKGASMLISAKLIKKIGLFDADFWNYYEETDFCHRAWLAGYECWYYPNAKAYHEMGMTSSRFENSQIQFHNYKNKLLSYLKNFEKRTLIKVVPIFVLSSVLLSIVWLIQGRYRNSIAVYKGLAWNIHNLRNTLEKRKKIQKIRRKTDKEIFMITKKNPHLRYYFNLFGDLGSYEDKI